jgi:hypothetical protein
MLAETTAKPTAASIATELTLPKLILLFCLASDIHWQAVGRRASKT